METLETTPGRCILTVAGKERESFEITEETFDHMVELGQWFMDDTIDDWEERYPDCKDLSYIVINLESGDVRRWKIWTRAKSVNYDSTDGWFNNYKITDLPICIAAEDPGKPFSVIGSPSNDWLYKDINHLTGLQFDYLAEIKLEKEINWGFNGVNALMLFKEKCEEYTTMNQRGDEYVLIKYNPEIGYWFGTIGEETMNDPKINVYAKTLVKDEETS